MKPLDVAVLAIGTAALAFGLAGGAEAYAPQGIAAMIASDGMSCEQSLLERGPLRLAEEVERPQKDDPVSDASDEEREGTCATDRNFIEPTPPPPACEPNAERHDQVIFCWWARLL
jgi:hypothetical protein